MYQGGLNYFVYEPGILKDGEPLCNVCNSVMDIRRNVMGPTSFAEAMGKVESLHDAATCPNSEEEWHEHIILLINEEYETISKKLKAIIRDEIEEVLRERKV